MKLRNSMSSGDPLEKLKRSKGLEIGISEVSLEEGDACKSIEEPKKHKMRNSKKMKNSLDSDDKIQEQDFKLRKKNKKLRSKKSKNENVVEDTSSPDKSKMKAALANESPRDNALEVRAGEAEDEVYLMSSGDEDCSKGMKKWITEYHQSRPGLKILQEKIDEFIVAHEEQQEKTRMEREAQVADGGWTVVVHHKGRKKSTDAESGVAVGSVAQAAVLEKLSKKKMNNVGVDFYQFQRREAHRNEIMMLQSKFEQDKKRIQQLRAARKFRPY